MRLPDTDIDSIDEYSYAWMRRVSTNACCKHRSDAESMVKFSETRDVPMSVWQSIGFGAIDTSDAAKYGNGGPVSYVVLPIYPSPPLMLNPGASELWANGLGAVSTRTTAVPDEEDMLSEFVAAGIASRGETMPEMTVVPPVLESVEHELVYSLIAGLCDRNSIEYVFVKGPIQHQYGLRERKHSADVDVWIDPSRIQEFVSIIEQWGWNADTERWVHSHFNHSITLNASTWGCQIDVHRYFPGSTRSAQQAFATVLEWRTTEKYAAVDVSVLSKPAAAVLYALHGIRPESRHRKKTMSVSDAAKALKIGGREAIQFCEEFSCTEVLYDALSEAFPNESVERTNNLPVDWKWRAEPSWVRAYFMILKSLEPHDWISFLKDVMRSPTSVSGSSKSGMSGIRRILYRAVPRRLKRKPSVNRFFLWKR